MTPFFQHKGDAMPKLKIGKRKMDEPRPSPASLAADEFKRMEADSMIRQHPDSHGIVYALLRETREREIMLQRREAKMVKQARLQALRDARAAVANMPRYYDISPAMIAHLTLQAIDALIERAAE